MRTRMQPVSAAWARLPRLVRDVALACGKRVRIEMQGDGTELDRALVEALKDPLTHLVRNAIDHGIEDAAARARAGKPEEGALRLSAYEEGGSVRLELADDGAGMDVERIRAQAIARGLVDAERARALSDEDYLAFVFVAGFSTAAKVTNISGRGVGLDAARAGIEAVGGSLTVRSTAGAGTTFHIRLPLTLAILPALTIEQSGDIYAIPQAHVLELVRCGGDHAHIEHAHGRAMFRLRGELLPVVELGRWLAAGDAGETPEPHADAEHAARHVLVLAAEGARYGLAVERVRDTEEIVVKPIGHRLREGGAFAGATVLGDGRVALILDAHALALRAGTGQATTTAPAAAAAAAAPERATRVPLLRGRARRGVRAAVPLAEVDRVVEFESAAFERLHEQPAVRLDGEVLEVAAFAGDPSLAAAGGPGCAEFAGAPRMWPVLIHGGNGHRVGLVVDQVVDIVDWDGAEAPAARGATGQRRIVLDDHITDLVTLSEEAA
jgi:two-component system chemotaxis sensor kinase CheA